MGLTDTTSIWFQVHLADLLPPIYKAGDSEQPDKPLQMLMKSFGQVLDSIQDNINSFLDIWDIDTCPASFLPYISHELGWEMDRSYSQGTQRKILKLLVQLYKIKGTKVGILAILRLFLEKTVEIYNVWNRCWRLGVSGRTELGINTWLGPGGWSKYWFCVFFPEDTLSEEEKASAFYLVSIMRPNYTYGILRDQIGYYFGSQE